MTGQPVDDQALDGEGSRYRAGPPGVPRWVKLSGVVLGILLVALLVIMITAGGDHGPSRH